MKKQLTAPSSPEVQPQEEFPPLTQGIDDIFRVDQNEHPDAEDSHPLDETDQSQPNFTVTIATGGVDPKQEYLFLDDPEWPLSDVGQHILTFVILSNLEALPTTCLMMSLVSKSFKLATTIIFERSRCLKTIKTFAPRLKIELDRFNLSEEAPDVSLRNLAKGILGLYGISKRIRELEDMYTDSLTNVVGPVFEFAVGYPKVALSSRCDQLFTSLKIISSKSTIEIKIVCARLAADLSLMYLRKISSRAKHYGSNVSGMTTTNLQPHYDRIVCYLEFVANSLNQLAAWGELKAHSHSFTVVARLRYELKQNHCSNNIEKVIKKLNINREKALPCLVENFTPAAEQMPVDPIQMNQHHPALGMLRHLHPVQKERYYVFWMMAIGVNYAGSRSLFQALNENNRQRKLVATLLCIPDQIRLDITGRLIASMLSLVDDRNSLCFLMDRYQPKEIAVLVSLKMAGRDLLRNLVSKEALIAAFFPRIIRATEGMVSAEEIRAAQWCMLTYCLAAENLSQLEVVEASNSELMSGYAKKFQSYLEEKFPGKNHPFPYQLMTLPAFQTFCDTVRREDRCSVWEYFAKKPLQGLLFGLTLDTELFKQPSVFIKINRMTYHQVLSALAFLNDFFEKDNLTYIKQDVDNIHTFLDWITASIPSTAEQPIEDFRVFAAVLPLKKVLELPPVWKIIFQNLCPRIQKRDLKKDDLRKCLEEIPPRLDERSAELVLQLQPGLLDRKQGSLQLPTGKTTIPSTLSPSQMLDAVIQLGQLYCLSAEALTTLLVIKRKTNGTQYLEHCILNYKPKHLLLLLSKHCSDPLADPATESKVRLIDALSFIYTLRGLNDFLGLPSEHYENLEVYLTSIFSLPGIRSLISYLHTHTVPVELLSQFSVEDITYLYETVTEGQSLFSRLFCERTRDEFLACAELFKNIRIPGEGDEDDEEQDASAEEIDFQDLQDTPESCSTIVELLTYYSHLLVRLSNVSLYEIQKFLFVFNTFLDKDVAQRVMRIPTLSAFLLNSAKPDRLFNELHKRELWSQLIQWSNAPGLAQICVALPVDSNPLLTPEFLQFAANQQTQFHQPLLEWLCTTQPETIDCLFAMLDIAHYQQRQCSLQVMGEVFITELQENQLLNPIIHNAVINRDESQRDRRLAFLKAHLEGYQRRRQTPAPVQEVHQPRAVLIATIGKFASQFSGENTVAESIDQLQTQYDVRKLKKQLTAMLECLELYEKQLPDDQHSADSEDEENADAPAYN